MKNTNLVKKNKRLKDELDEILGRDELYTLRSHDKQSAEGNRREDKIADWLDKKDIKYFTENVLLLAKGTDLLFSLLTGLSLLC